MWYRFNMYDAEGRRMEIVDINAERDSEAWSKASDYAYNNGYEDYDMYRHVNRIRHELYRG